MKVLRSFFSGFLSNSPAPQEAAEPGFDFDAWNRIGRSKAEEVCRAFEAIIDRGEDVDMDFTDDERTEEFADAVLDEVVALNEAGQWQKARARFDPAYQPFVSHMGDLGLHAVVILGPERFLVQLGDEVLHIDGQAITVVKGASTFAISRNRRWLCMATDKGLSVSAGIDVDTQTVTPWPEGIDVDHESIRTLDIADDGCSIALASDAFGIWLLKNGAWTALAPRPGVGDQDEEDDQEDSARGADGVRNVGTENCPVYVGSYAQIKAKFGGPLDLDASHAAISPDGQYVAYGWQDAWGGHYVDRVTGTTVEPLGRIEAKSDYPYGLRFSSDSRRLLSNSRHGADGVTVCCDLVTLADEAQEPPATDEYLRAYGMAELPGDRFGLTEPVAWIGGAGWTHAAAFSGGKPVFTHFLGSAVRAFDFDPVSGRVAVASASGVLHVLDPFTEAEPGRERGYHPRRELFRWVFWESLDAPIRW